MVTADYGVTLLNAELKPIATKELPIDKLTTVAFNEKTGELFYAASGTNGSSDMKTLMKATVSQDGIGEPTSVGTVPEAIRGIGVDADSGVFLQLARNQAMTPLGKTADISPSLINLPSVR